MAAGNVSPQTFAVSLLQNLRAPVTPANVKAIVGWSQAEGGNWNNSARYNPLNTTQGAPGATSINGVGVKAYQNWQQGIQATVQTLNNGHYGNILAALRAGNNPGAVAQAIGSSPWGTDAATVAQTIARASGGVPRTPSSLGASLPTTPGQTVASTRQVFNAGAYNQAKARAIAGQYISATGKDPFTLGEPRTGISTAGDANPLLTSGELTTSTPNPANYMKAQTTLQHLAGSVPLNQHPAAFSAALKGSGYTDPLPGAQWERTDMGVDASMRNGAAIKAIGDSKVVSISPNWYQGQPIVKFQLLNGPDAGKFYYIAEAINPTVRAGDVVRAGQTVGTYNSGGTGLELGWATSGSQTLAQATTGYTEGQQTTAGKSFRNFLNGLGAGAGSG